MFHRSDEPPARATVVPHSASWCISLADGYITPSSARLAAGLLRIPSFIDVATTSKRCANAAPVRRAPRVEHSRCIVGRPPNASVGRCISTPRTHSVAAADSEAMTRSRQRKHMGHAAYACAILTRTHMLVGIEDVALLRTGTLLQSIRQSLKLSIRIGADIFCQ
ncbi:hypothetical protein GY45DRAFT_818175 [Cubamyces sp. BRFM 1775]|nr:hypothetical protein GY45DRAFT_818175 [Cubamyces sp. BRFM 1775]